MPAPRPRVAASRRSARADRRPHRASRTTANATPAAPRTTTLADEIERIGVGAFLERWLSQPLFASLDRSDGDIEARLTNTAAGLASSLRLAGTGTQAPLWTRLGELAMPVLVVAGEHDAKFTAIGRRMADSIPDASFVAHRGRRPRRPSRTTGTDLRRDRDVARLPSAAERQPEREQRAVGELRPTRRSEHGDQGRSAGAVDHRSDRHGSDRDREHRERAPAIRQIAATTGERERRRRRARRRASASGGRPTAPPACACRRSCRSGCRGGC